MRAITLALAAALVLPAAASAAGAPASFYKPPSKLPGKKHGDLIRTRKITGITTVPGAKRTDALLYRSTGLTGKPVAVSGTLSIPKGKAPKGGWPVISYAHGTTGIADSCAPSRITSDDALVTYAYPMMTKWLKAGFAVARTDYEGLGTPGVHPYLIGGSEGRSTLDIVLAAKKDNKAVNTKKVILAGHSQGGHAALWANSLAPKYTPKLKIRGTVALAPASHTGEQAQAISALKSPSGISGLAAMILRGVAVQHPELNVAGLLAPAPAALFPKVDTDCLTALDTTAEFGQFAPADLLKPYSDISALVAALNANDPEAIAVHAPLRIEQGASDSTVFPTFTDALVDTYQKAGTKLTYDKVANLTHSEIVTTPSVQKTVLAWIKKQTK